MRHVLKKETIWLEVRSSSGVSDNLMGRDFTLTTEPGLVLAIDLTGNLRTRNKQVNSYLDAVALKMALEKDDLSRISALLFTNTQISKRLLGLLPSLESKAVDLALEIRLERTHSLRAKLACDKQGSVLLRVG